MVKRWNIRPMPGGRVEIVRTSNALEAGALGAVVQVRRVVGREELGPWPSLVVRQRAAGVRRAWWADFWRLAGSPPN